MRLSGGRNLANRNVLGWGETGKIEKRCRRDGDQPDAHYNKQHFLQVSCFWIVFGSWAIHLPIYHMPFDLFWFKQTVGAFLLFLTRLLETPWPWCPIAAPLVTYKNISDFSPSNWDISLIQEPYLTFRLRYWASALTLSLMRWRGRLFWWPS